MSDPWRLIRPLFRALGSELASIVVVGGWAFRLHALHDWTQDIDIEPIMTFDADLLVESPVSDIGYRLMEAGFRVERDGRTRPPIEKFYYSSQGEELEVEFPDSSSGW